MAHTITPFLMFEGGVAEEAMRHYVGLFPGGAILDVTRWAAGEPGVEGSVKIARFSVAGQRIACSDTPVKHGFGFTPALSLFVECESEAELERLFAGLSDGGRVLMPLADYGFSRRFGWVDDRFGVSWQLNLT